MSLHYFSVPLNGLMMTCVPSCCSGAVFKKLFTIILSTFLRYLNVLYLQIPQYQLFVVKMSSEVS
jgi:hypothetical protein